MALQLLLLLYLLEAVVSQPYNCPEIATSELGDTSTHSTDGIVPPSFLPPAETSSPPALLIYEHQVTCSVAGTTPDTFQYLSVVVFFNCADQPSGALDCEDTFLGGVGNFTMQIELRCSPTGPNVEWIRGDFILADTPSTITAPADGSLATERDSQCGLCLKNSRSGTLLPGSVYDTESHCVGEFITSTVYI